MTDDGVSPARACLCRSGFEDMLARELADAGLRAGSPSPGLVTLGSGEPTNAMPAAGWAFASADLFPLATIAGDSVNALGGALCDWFAEALRGEQVATPWPCVFSAVDGVPGLGRRAAAVERAFHEKLSRRLGRVARLALAEASPGTGPVRGLFAVFTGFDSVLVSRDAWLGGQRRMADDPAAPARSYLKVEEAYGVAGGAPEPGQLVCDLGAAPGGWAFSAAKRGALVTAVDNGLLKGGALDHPLVEHLQQDAFVFRPRTGQVYDWLFCDLVEEPHHVLRGVLEPWLAGRWCRRFVVNLKFGRTDANALLRELRAGDSVLGRLASGARVRHLHHDRDEFTIVGASR